MRNNDGENTKKVTIVIPESTELIDIVYYWRDCTGLAIKSSAVLVDESCNDGTVATIFSFPKKKEADNVGTA